MDLLGDLEGERLPSLSFLDLSLSADRDRVRRRLSGERVRDRVRDRRLKNQVKIKQLRRPLHSISDACKELQGVPKKLPIFKLR